MLPQRWDAKYLVQFFHAQPLRPITLVTEFSLTVLLYYYRSPPIAELDELIPLSFGQRRQNSVQLVAEHQSILLGHLRLVVLEQVAHAANPHQLPSQKRIGPMPNPLNFLSAQNSG